MAIAQNGMMNAVAESKTRLGGFNMSNIDRLFTPRDNRQLYIPLETDTWEDGHDRWLRSSLKRSRLNR